MHKKAVEDIDVVGKRVMVRVDFNAPQDRSGTITDDNRLRASLPTIQYLKDHRARIVLCSHLGRPKGKPVEELRMAPMANRLAELLHCPVHSVRDCVGQDVEKAVNGLRDGDALLLENLRFHPEEEENDPDFACALAKLADIYVNDAFGTAHRAHASTSGIARYLPAVAGLLMKKEIEVLDHVLESPARNFATVVGGAKAKDKLGLLENILTKVDCLLVGGGMAATFLKVQGHDIGGSAVEEENMDSVQRIMHEAKDQGVSLLLPSDVVVAKTLEITDTSSQVTSDRIPEGWKIMDIGSDTINRFSSQLTGCKTVLWNGPMGIFEIPRFAKGTEAIASTIANLNAITVIGGGSTAEAVGKLGLASSMTHVSTGGGASLMFLEGKELPGIAVLCDK